MKASISINNSEIVYLIHGQYFRLDYDFSNCFALIFIYDNGEKVEKYNYPQKKAGFLNTIYVKIILPFINFFNLIYWGLRIKKFYKKIYFKRSKGVFENATNSYNPNLKIIALGLGYKVFRYKLKINFINSKPPEMEVNPINSPDAAQMNIDLKLPHFKLPLFNKSKGINFQVNRQTIIINDHKELDRILFDSGNK